MSEWWRPAFSGLCRYNSKFGMSNLNLMAPSWHDTGYGWAQLQAGPPCAAFHQWQASLHSNLINPIINYFLSTRVEFLKFLLHTPPGSLATGDLRRDSPLEPGRSGRAGPRMTPGPHPAIRESPVSGRLASWQHTSPQNLGICQHHLHWPRSGRRWTRKQRNDLIIIKQHNVKHDSWKFGNHNMFEDGEHIYFFRWK